MKLLGTVQQGTTALLLLHSANCSNNDLLVFMARARSNTQLWPWLEGLKALRGLRGPVGTNGRGGYRVPCGYVTDMKPNYVAINISKHNFEKTLLSLCLKTTKS